MDAILEILDKYSRKFKKLTNKDEYSIKKLKRKLIGELEIALAVNLSEAVKGKVRGFIEDIKYSNDITRILELIDSLSSFINDKIYENSKLMFQS
ncbi:MAG: hypothetical protein M1385_00100 [Candidatus Marsarchaeota archaeon]|nr:hypothetical protein [Candidatus Marsarchaeota archaeon]